MGKDLMEGLLLEKKLQLESSLKEIESDDNYLYDSPVEVEEMSAASFAFERSRILILKKNLEEMLHKINLSLQKIKNNTYGVCDKCRKFINPERLQAMPAANLCISCTTIAI